MNRKQQLSIFQLVPNGYNKGFRITRHFPVLKSDIDPLNFGDTGFKPFSRCLNFQARQARLYAIKKGWKKMSWDFNDFWSETNDIENVKSWLKTMDSQSNVFEPIPVDDIIDIPDI